MSRLTASDRLRRLLAVIPWVSDRGSVPLAEIADRFDYPLDRLRADLSDVVQYVGVYPYTPDMLIEVVLDGDEEHVSFALADYFEAPLQLTPEEGLQLVSAGLGLLGTDADADGALRRGLDKIAARFDVELGSTVNIDLGSGDPALLADLRAAVAERRCVEIVYYSAHSGASATRTIEPHHVYTAEGRWYVVGYCRLAESERTFRVDRVLSYQLGDDHFDPIASAAAGSVPTQAAFAASEDDLRVTLRLSSAASWVAEAFPIESSEVIDGDTIVTLAASSRPWLARLLLQLGPDAVLVDSVPELASDFVSSAANRVLDVYR